MPEFNLSKDYESQLTTVAMRGVVTAQDVVTIIGLENYGETSKALWDMTGAELYSLDSNDLKWISQSAKPIDRFNDVQAVAILVKNEADRALVRLFVDMALYISHRPLPHFVTCSRQEAVEWLDGIVSNANHCDGL